METERFSTKMMRKSQDDIEISWHWKDSVIRRQGIASHIHSVTHGSDACEEYMAQNYSLITFHYFNPMRKNTESTRQQ